MINPIKKLIKIKKEIKVKNSQNLKSICETSKYFKEVIERLNLDKSKESG